MPFNTIDTVSLISADDNLHDALYAARDVLNTELFGDVLPPSVITLQRKNRSYGFFAAQQYGTTQGNETRDEIALNPIYFSERSLIDCLAELAHGMVHHYQFHNGKPGRGSYHNKEWARMMKSIGLQPTSTGDASGKPTGDKMTQIVIPGGPFENVANLLIESGFALEWYDRAEILRAEFKKQEQSKPSKSGKRVKYVCPLPDCKQYGLSGFDASISCTIHNKPLIPEQKKRR